MERVHGTKAALMKVTYYAELRCSRTRHKESRAAADLARYTTLGNWITGVIVDPSKDGSGPLWIESLPIQPSQRKGATALVNLARETIAGALKAKAQENKQ